jgi:hypothetical protein
MERLIDPIVADVQMGYEQAIEERVRGWRSA